MTDIEKILSTIGADKLRQIADILDSDSEIAPSSIGIIEDVHIVNPPIPVAPLALHPTEECTRDKTYRVLWTAEDDHSGHLNLQIHPDSPILELGKPYVGTLCEHEAGFFSGRPGVDFSLNWNFNITIEDAKKQKGKK